MAKRSRVVGAKQTAANFRALNRILVPAGRSATRKSIEPVVAQAKANLKSDGSVLSGRLLKSLTAKLAKGAKLKPTYHAGPDKKAGVFWAHFVEWGRAAGANGKGAMPGTRFMTRAFGAVKSGIVPTFSKELGPAIERYAAQLAKKVPKK